MNEEIGAIRSRGGDPEGSGGTVPTSEEVGAALRHCWQPVARVADLEAGPKRAVILGEPLAVFLGESGAPAVVADRCPHRGASLSMGAVRGEALECPYHGWQWRGRDGECVRLPSLTDQGQIPPRARVEAFPVRVQWGLVWTVLGEPRTEPPQPSWFDPGDWELGHGTPFEIPVGFGVMIENFRDVSHLAFVHRETFGKISAAVEPLKVKRQGIEVAMAREMSGGPDGDEIWGSLREVRYQTIAPIFTSAVMVSAKGRRCLLHMARAISAVESAHYWIEGLSEDYEDHTLEEAIAAEERLYVEDCEVISAVEPRELPLDPDSQVSTVADKFTLAYRAAVAEFVRGV